MEWSRLICGLAFWPLVIQGQPDIADLLKRCQEADDRNAAAERNYVFEQRTENRYLDAHGNVKGHQVETFDTLLTGGRSYRRLIGRNDQPLKESEEKKEQAKQQREADARAKETPAEREKALAAEETRRQKNRELTRETLNAFDFRLVGEDAETWTLEATPRPGFRAPNGDTAVLKHFRGKLWISKKDYIWTKLDAEVTDSISFGLVIARMDRGAHIQIERTHVNNEVWLPKRIAGGGEGRLALVKMRVSFETTCRNYRRFSADSRLVPDPVK